MKTLVNSRRLACPRLRVERLEDRSLPAVTIGVNAALDRHAINPLVYGTAFASTAQLLDLNSPFNRSGGNATTRYNWQANATNRASDWYFESLPDSGSAAGQSADQFVSETRAGGAQPSLTIPTIGWVARLGPGRTRLASFPRTTYPNQTAYDPWWSEAGNGQTSAGPITGNNPNVANQPANPAFQQGWIQHLVSTWGGSAAGGVRYYSFDNEPSIWHHTHRDVHPNGAPMAEVRDAIINYAAMVRSVDPNAVLIGPEEWGWSGYFLSGKDQQYGNQTGNWGNLPDKTANGNWDYLPWILNQVRQHDVANGTRSMDVFSVHYYPQANEFGNDVSQSMQLLRNRSTRSLWDTTYVDQSWIGTTGQPDGGIVKLIPRLKNWVNTYYPGLQTGLTEYNWGAEGHMNGATTQADIFGIFGREGLDLGNRWTTPSTNSPTYLAMKMYRNYDGQDHTFGETSIRATVPNPDQVSAYAAVRADGALTVMVINKNLYNASTPNATTEITIGLSNFAHGLSAQRWQLAATNAAQTSASITRLADVNFTADSLSFNAPMQSVTMFVIAPPPPTVAPLSANDGAQQRSQVTSLTVTFSGPVTFAGDPSAAFRLSRTGPSGPTGNVTLAVDLSGSTATQTIARLTFSGTLTETVGSVNSLIDGIYSLTIFNGQVRDGTGQALDGNGNGVAGDDYTSPSDSAAGTGPKLFRLFGDADGNGVVDLVDLGQFRSSFNAGAGNPAYLSYLDADGNGVVDLVDLGQLRNRFNSNLFP
jgi:hypothetical protein